MKRRDFLKLSAPATVLPSFINGFSIKAFGASPLLNALQGAATDNDHVLVMIQLNGGNDGLNMVIPLDQYGKYQAARTNIAIQEGKVLKLEKYTRAGLHPSMTGVQRLYNEGKVCVVQSVGYPSPNYSHFRATDIWVTGSDANQVLSTGWGGRYLNYEYPNYPNGFPNAEMPDPLAIQIGSIVSPAFQGPTNTMAMAVTSATDFYNLISGKEDPVPNTKAGNELAYIRLIAKQTNKFADSIKLAAGKVTNQGQYPKSHLAEQLKIVARLVAGGLKTRLYMVSMGGFDTHANQTNAGDTSTGMHANLMEQLSSSIDAFMKDLTNLKASKRVVGMTFSEFGRRIKSNGSMGTDHGASAPMIIFGDYVQSGVLGNTPTMPDAASVNDNIPMQYDFRSVYGSLLEQWFCVNNGDLQTILLRNYQSLPIVRPQACGLVTGVDPDPNQTAGTNIITNYPNPFTTKTNITYITQGGHTLVQIFDTMGRMIHTLVDRIHVAGTYNLVFDGERLPTGVYYARFQNGMVQQVRTMLKVR
ncbi:putative secreted protein (Por secretion system target) [Chitinophaga skermanii]|uniref:Putative secreted protein (Por secretion system target) n=1 Tax=Chitinophaga skermanii TaxID=331697 RepID=A0A327R4V8_9BACT|nr:DUF1501 domain-containing protein [Chitinophaga skermanii]RAJ10794.1 putative secreted protein (Por secretion system target) [Chitinophaga skermanii]